RDKMRMAKVERCCKEVRQVTITPYNQGIEPTRSYVTQHLQLMVTGTEGWGTLKALLVHDGDGARGSRADVSRQSSENESTHEEPQI
ncbi:MAG: hypothetical protein LH702_23000, partial [Phormidesmis sp. CAN_BIN44]|nr:hypothetical protein [Phormidesmis sp. CAN_BIN44]